MAGRCRDGRYQLGLRIREPVILSTPDGTGHLTSSHWYTHTFSVTTSHTIIIAGQNITHLYCNGLQLATLVVTRNTALTYLACNGNRLANLDVSKNATLGWLDCYKNQLTGLDVSSNVRLNNLNCQGNQFFTTGLNTLLRTLSSNYSAGTKTICIYGNSGTSDCNQSIATDKDWAVDTTLKGW